MFQCLPSNSGVCRSNFPNPILSSYWWWSIFCWRISLKDLWSFYRTRKKGKEVGTRRFDRKKKPKEKKSRTQATAEERSRYWFFYLSESELTGKHLVTRSPTAACDSRVSRILNPKWPLPFAASEVFLNPGENINESSSSETEDTSSHISVLPNWNRHSACFTHGSHI